MGMKKKILAVDDELDVLEYLASYLPLVGYELETASGGMEALAKVNAFRPDVILLDILMPGVDGMAVLRDVKKHYPSIKVIIITATRTQKAELLAEGADDVLYKPLDLTELSERVKLLLPAGGEAAAAGAEYARLLIVEDETEISDYLKEIVFDPLGYEVYTAEDADKAYAVCKDKRPHIVIVDLAIPSTHHGYNLIQRLAHTADFPVPKSIIIATAALGNASDELRRKGYPVIDKPIDYERLKERVFEACRKHGLRLKTGSGK